MAAADENGGAVSIVPFDPSAGHRTRRTGRCAEPPATPIASKRPDRFRKRVLAPSLGNCGVFDQLVSAYPGRRSHIDQLRPTFGQRPGFVEKEHGDVAGLLDRLHVPKEDTSAPGPTDPAPQPDRPAHPTTAPPY